MSNWPVMAPTCCVGGGYLYSTATSSGTAITSNLNAYGSYVEVVASCPFDVTGIRLSIRATNNNIVDLDIAIGSAGSEVVIVPDVWSYPASVIDIPIAIPRGQRIAIRTSGDNQYANTTALVGVELTGKSFLVPVGYQRMARLAAAATNDAGGAANTLSAWAQVTASLTFTARILVVGVACVSPANGGFALWQVGVGAAASEVAVGRGFFYTGGYQTTPVWEVIPGVFPAGSRIAFRHSGDNTAASSPRNVQYVVYALG